MNYRLPLPEDIPGCLTSLDLLRTNLEPCFADWESRGIQQYGPSSFKHLPLIMPFPFTFPAPHKAFFAKEAFVVPSIIEIPGSYIGREGNRPVCPCPLAGVGRPSIQRHVYPSNVGENCRGRSL